ncbi:YqhA family protein [Cognataquiflexum rubidum]|uniref:YqhA family protein n=1 Tax=Cognataquiflexum rubidum TaxID=2922273 RepID=UPI001F133585|nr:YqhA family protein [Cognataquiflexum rubidum]MCH6233451.1 YqhA family protein [Cognataquiflexum rubidum]
MVKVYKSTVLIISLTMFSNFLFTAGLGVYKTIHAYSILYSEGIKGKPGLEIVESLDLFLVALVFLILSLGFMKLFYPDFGGFKKLELPWLLINNFFELKNLTWNAILLTLLITFGTHVLRANGPLDWEILIIPTSVVMFSISSKLLKH